MKWAASHFELWNPSQRNTVFLQKEVTDSDFNTFPLLLWLQIPGLSFPHSAIVTQNLVWFSLFFPLLPCSSITITTSCFPVPSICSRDPVNDWFESLAECLHWNVRKKQNYLSSEDEEFWGRFQDPRGLLQGLQDSWGPGFSLTVLCAILSFTDRGGLTKLHSTNHHFNVALHKNLNAKTKKSFGAKQHFCCSLPCFILVAHKCGN